MCSSRFLDRIDIYDLNYTFLKYEKDFKEMNNSDLTTEEKEFSENFIDRFVSHKQLPSYMGFSKINFNHIGLVNYFIKRIKETGLLLLRYSLEKKYFKDFDYETIAVLKLAIKSLWKRQELKFRAFFQKNIFENFDVDEKFFFFPLHFQPEASTSVWATYYCDQLNAIKNIAFTLPFPYKLVVKEHPVAVGTRSISFYKKLKAIPNVILISPYENMENAIKKSLGVITLTGNAGLEAALSGKIVYVLGNAFYSYHPLCRRLKGFEELKNRIEDDLNLKKDVKNLRDINNRFVTSYFRNTIEGNIISTSVGKDINDYKLIYQNLKNILLK